jgi:hypothetical protein
MKIENILEIIEPEMRTRYTDRNLPREMPVDRSSEKFVGSGHFSSVKKSHDPHMVVKSSKNSSTEEDGYWVFVQYILKHKLWENPYFPRLYKNTTVQQRNTENAFKRVTLEKLQSLNDFIASDNNELVVALYRKCFGEKIADMVENKSLTVYAFSDLIRDIYNDNLPHDYVPDPDLVKALKIIKKIAEKERFLLDLHMGNMMVRNTWTTVGYN